MDEEEVTRAIKILNESRVPTNGLMWRDGNVYAYDLTLGTFDLVREEYPLDELEN